MPSYSWVGETKIQMLTTSCRSATLSIHDLFKSFGLYCDWLSSDKFMEEKYKLGTIQRFQQSVGTRYTPAAVVRMPYSRRPSEQSCLFGLPQLSGKAMKAKSSSRQVDCRVLCSHGNPSQPGLQSSQASKAARGDRHVRRSAAIAARIPNVRLFIPGHSMMSRI